MNEFIVNRLVWMDEHIHEFVNTSTLTEWQPKAHGVLYYVFVVVTTFAGVCCVGIVWLLYIEKEPVLRHGEFLDALL